MSSVLIKARIEILALLCLAALLLLTLPNKQCSAANRPDFNSIGMHLVRQISPPANSQLPVKQDPPFLTRRQAWEKERLLLLNKKLKSNLNKPGQQKKSPQQNPEIIF